MTTIRSVTPDDANAWLHMRHALWSEAPMVELEQEINRYFAGDRREPAEVLLAVEADGAPVGFAELSIRNIVDGCDSGRVAYLEGWYIVPPCRRKGIGRALIQAAERWALAQGCGEFGSDSEINNNVSFAAHLRAGFEEVGQARTFRKALVSDGKGPGRDDLDI